MQYLVKQGDHLAKIASEHGFADWRTIWNRSENAVLKKRRDPNVLYPGDKLFLPERETKQESAATDKRNRFVVRKQPLELRLALKDFGFKALAGQECVLEVDGEPARVRSGGDGVIKQAIPPHAQRAMLRLTGAKASFTALFAIDIGHLDPVDTVTGQKARLNNLGYAAGPLDEEDEARFKSAVEEFQCDHGLAVDGKCGPKTQAKLEEIHGC